ncbi:hypothetical protein VULLAG_LOCUS17530 [Vulpes lagopus]
MASTDYNTYSQAAAQQGYSVYNAQPTQGYPQTTQAYGQQSYGTYGQPTDVSYTPAQTTATYGQTPYSTSYGQPPVGYTTPTAPQAYIQPVQGYGTGIYDTTTANGHYHPGLLCSSVCIWHSACLPSLWAAASSHRTCKTTGR